MKEEPTVTLVIEASKKENKVSFLWPNEVPKLTDSKGREIELSSLNESNFFDFISELIAYYRFLRIKTK